MNIINTEIFRRRASRADIITLCPGTFTVLQAPMYYTKLHNFCWKKFLFFL